MSIVNSEIHEGVLLQEEFVSIHVSVFEDLIRAETERDILESILTGENKYTADDVLKAIQTAREKHHRGALRIEIGSCPCKKPDTAVDKADDTGAVAGDAEDPADDAACE